VESNAGTSCEVEPNKTLSDTGDYKVCLTVTNSSGISSDEVCQNLKVIEHDAPTAVINIFQEMSGENIDVTDDSSLQKDTSYTLSCKNSKNDCPGDTSGLECEWLASSYKMKNGSCNVPANEREYKFEDCLAAHNVNNKSTPSTTTSLPVMYTCNSNDYDCIEVKLKVTDTRYNKTAETSKVYRAQ
jgi:hypothetical protein